MDSPAGKRFEHQHRQLNYYKKQLEENERENAEVLEELSKLQRVNKHLESEINRLNNQLVESKNRYADECKKFEEFQSAQNETANELKEKLLQKERALLQQKEETDLLQKELSLREIELQNLTQSRIKDETDLKQDDLSALQHELEMSAEANKKLSAENGELSCLINDLRDELNRYKLDQSDFRASETFATALDDNTRSFIDSPGVSDYQPLSAHFQEDNNRLKAEVSNVRNELDLANARFAETTEYVSQLEAQVNQLTNAATKHKDEFKKLSDVNDEIREDRNGLLTQLDDRKHRIRSLEDELGMQQTLAAELESRISDLSADNSEKTIQAEKLNNELNAQQETLSFLSGEKLRLEIFASEKESEIELLRVKLKETDADIDRLKKDLSAVETSVMQGNDEKANLLENLSTLQANLNDANLLVNETKSNLTETNLKLQNANAEIEELQESLRTCRKQLAITEQELSLKSSHSKDLETEILALKDTLNSERNAFKQQLASLKSDISSQNEKNVMLNATNAELEQAYSNLNVMLTETKELVQALEVQCSSTTAEKSHYFGLLSDQTKISEQLTSDLHDLKGQLSEHATENSALKEKVHDLIVQQREELSRNDILTEKSTDLENEIRSLKMRLEHLTCENDAEINRLRERESKLVEENSALQEVLAERENEIKVHVSESENSAESLKSLEKSNTDLVARLTCLENEQFCSKQDFEKREQEIKAEISKLNLQLDELISEKENKIQLVSSLEQTINSHKEKELFWDDESKKSLIELDSFLEQVRELLAEFQNDLELPELFVRNDNDDEQDMCLSKQMKDRFHPSLNQITNAVRLITKRNERNLEHNTIIDDLNSQNLKLASELAENARQVNEYSIKFDLFKSTVSDLSNREQDLIGQKVSLTATIDSQQMKLTSLRNQVDSLENEAKKLKAEKELASVEASQREDSLKRAVQESKDQESSIRDEKRKILLEMNDHMNKILELSNEIEVSNKSNKQLNKTVTELTENLQGKNELLKDVEEKLSQSLSREKVLFDEKSKLLKENEILSRETQPVVNSGSSTKTNHKGATLKSIQPGGNSLLGHEEETWDSSFGNINPLLNKSNTNIISESKLGVPPKHICESSDMPPPFLELRDHEESEEDRQRRLDDLHRRNTMVAPHLRSNYPIETQMLSESPKLTSSMPSAQLYTHVHRSQIKPPKPISKRPLTENTVSKLGRGESPAKIPKVATRVRVGDPLADVSNSSGIGMRPPRPSTAFEIPITPKQKKSSRLRKPRRRSPTSSVSSSENVTPLPTPQKSRVGALTPKQLKTKSTISKSSAKLDSNIKREERRSPRLKHKTFSTTPKFLGKAAKRLLNNK